MPPPTASYPPSADKTSQPFPAPQHPSIQTASRIEPTEFHTYAQDPPLYDPETQELNPSSQGQEWIEYEHQRCVFPPPNPLDDDRESSTFHTIRDHRSERKHWLDHRNVELVERFDRRVELKKGINKTTIRLEATVKGYEKGQNGEDIKYCKVWEDIVEIPVELFQRRTRGGDTAVVVDFPRNSGETDKGIGGGSQRKKRVKCGLAANRKRGMPFSEESGEEDGEN